MRFQWFLRRKNPALSLAFHAESKATISKLKLHLGAYKREDESITIMISLTIKKDSAQSSSNKWKNYLLKIYPQHSNFLNAI